MNFPGQEHLPPKPATPAPTPKPPTSGSTATTSTPVTPRESAILNRRATALMNAREFLAIDGTGGSLLKLAKDIDTFLATGEIPAAPADWEAGTE